MRVTGSKRWVVLVLVSLVSGLMVFVPFLRYSYYDQMVIVFTQSFNAVDAGYVNEFIGDMGMGMGLVSMVGYLFGGVLADKFSERNLMFLGCAVMALASVWYAFVPGQLFLILIHVLYGVGTVLIWSAYLKTARKMGTADEQGRMFSISEFIRAILGTAIGFFGSWILGMAIIGGSTDPAVLGSQWQIMLFVNAGLFIVLGILILVIVPGKIIGNEVAEGDEGKGETFSLSFVKEVVKLPGTWLLAALVFFCFSFTSAGAGYLGAFTTDVLGVDPTTASNFAVIRNYIIAGLATLAIGFVADKIGSKAKTLGIYLVLSTVAVVLLILTKNSFFVCVIVTFVFAIIYTGMRGIYFATLSEVGIPLKLTGCATGIISVIGYLPDVYFAKMAGGWIDAFGTTGYDIVWIWAIVCGVLGIVTAFITVRYSKKLAARKEAEAEG